MDAARSNRGQGANARELQHDLLHVLVFVCLYLCAGPCVSRASPFALGSCGAECVPMYATSCVRADLSWTPARVARGRPTSMVM